MAHPAARLTGQEACSAVLPQASAKAAQRGQADKRASGGLRREQAATRRPVRGDYPLGRIESMTDSALEQWLSWPLRVDYWTHCR